MARRKIHEIRREMAVATQDARIADAVSAGHVEC